MPTRIATLSDGSRMPMIGIGTYKLTGDDCIEAVKTALAAGYTHIDTATLYGNHEEIGIAIKGHDRSKLFITSKVWYDHLHYDAVLQSCEQALREVGTDYFDLYLIHWPNSSVPIEETFKAMKRLHDEGRIRSIGVSNFTIKHLEKALRVAGDLGITITVNQVEFHPMLHQKELLEYCRAHRIQLVAYSPLGHGNLPPHPILSSIGKHHGKDASQVCLRWLLDKGIVVIPKSATPSRIKTNIELDFQLTEDETKRIDGFPQQRFVHPGFAEF